MQITVNNKRNENGVKSSCDQFRTFNGERFVCASFLEDGATKAAEFRATGAKVRRCGNDVYVRDKDLYLIY